MEEEEEKEGGKWLGRRRRMGEKEEGKGGEGKGERVGGRKGKDEMVSPSHLGVF